MLPDTNKRLLEYDTSLQQYLQTDATKNSEAIAKLQKEKNTMVEKMNRLKDHTNSLQMQLDLAKVKILVTFYQYVIFVHSFLLRVSIIVLMSL